MFISRQQPPETITLIRSQSFITADKILISIHRIAMTIWIVKIIRIADIIFTKQIRLSHRQLQRVGMTLSGCAVLWIVRKTPYFASKTAKYGVFCSCFKQFKNYHFEFDQLSTNSFPLDYFYIYLQRFILSGKIVVEMQIFCKLPSSLLYYGGVL